MVAFFGLSNKRFTMVDFTRIDKIVESNKGKKLSASRIIQAAKKDLPILPKLIADPKSNIKAGENPIDDQNAVNYEVLRQITYDLYNKKKNNKYIIELFPDIELAIQILTSSILSPKKMNGSLVNYSLDKMIKLDPDLSYKFLNIIKEDINTHYKLDEKLSDMLRESLFETGSYVTAVIPETSVDDIINSDIIKNYATESIVRTSHELQKTKEIIPKIKPIVAAENKKIENFLKEVINENVFTLTDNFDILKLPKLRNKLRAAYVKNRIKSKSPMIVTEDLNYLDIFRKRDTKELEQNKNYLRVKTKEETLKKNVGRPMFIKIPSESIIPVFPPNDNQKHVGYFLLIDENGYPVSADQPESYLQKITNIVSTDPQRGQTSLASKAYHNLVNSQEPVDVRDIYQSYKPIIENILYESIKKSIYGFHQDFSNYNDIYYLMFTRAISEQKTGIVFIPKELVSYIAFDYNDNGTGKTLLSSLSVLSSLRAIMLFSKVMSYAKSAIDVTTVNVSFDPNDPDPNKTLETISDQVLKVRQNLVPVFTANPVELVDRLQRAGLRFTYENHPGMPNIKIDYDNTPMSHTIPDTDLDDIIRKQMIMGLGLAPEMVDNAFSPEFATSVVANNILLSKRVSIYQNKFTPMIKNFIEIVVENDEVLYSKLKKFVLKNKDRILDSLKASSKQLSIEDEEEFVRKVIRTFMNKLVISLPKPDNTNITNLSSEFDIYKDNLIKFVDSIVSSEIIPEDLAGELSMHVDTIKNTFVHHLLRKWAAENDYYPEALNLITEKAKAEDELSPNSKSVVEYLTKLYSYSVGILGAMSKYKDAVNKDLGNLNVEGSGASSMSSSGSSYSQSDSGASSDEDASDYGFGEKEGDDDDILSF